MVEVPAEELGQVVREEATIDAEWLLPKRDRPHELGRELASDSQRGIHLYPHESFS